MELGALSVATGCEGTIASYPSGKCSHDRIVRDAQSRGSLELMLLLMTLGLLGQPIYMDSNLQSSPGHAL